MKFFNIVPLALLFISGTVALPVENKDKFTSNNVKDAAVKAVDLDKAGEKRGAGAYPHEYKNHEKLSFAICRNPKTLTEHPLLAGGAVYDGSKNNKKQGDHRVVIDITDKGKDAIFCGLITHDPTTRQFVKCT
ncbi:MAG: hypothetical protein M1830_010812 [Pleopsidium flavum]|nr:MAG: hypothetical protein M1830_010812 [Pleopsidium flavum]